MSIYDPNTPLQKSYIDAIKIATDLSGWPNRVPIDTKSIPLQYFLIATQTKNRTAISKNNWEWLCTIVVDIIYAGGRGFSSPVKNNTVEAQIISAIEGGISVEGFYVKSRELISSIPLNIDTNTQYLERTVLTYQHWLGQIITT